MIRSRHAKYLAVFALDGTPYENPVQCANHHVRPDALVSQGAAETRLAQTRDVQLRPAPVEVVEGDDVPVGMSRREPARGAGADEAGAAGDQNPHAPPVI